MSQREIAAVLNLDPDKPLPGWWENINLGTVDATGQPSLETIFPDKLSSEDYVGSLLNCSGDWEWERVRRTADLMGAPPLHLARLHAARGQVGLAAECVTAVEAERREVGDELLGVVSSACIGMGRNDLLAEFLDIDANISRAVATKAGAIMSTACRRAEAFTWQLAETTGHPLLQLNLVMEAIELARAANDFESLI